MIKTLTLLWTALIWQYENALNTLEKIVNGISTSANIFDFIENTLGIPSPYSSLIFWILVVIFIGGIIFVIMLIKNDGIGLVKKPPKD